MDMTNIQSRVNVNRKDLVTVDSSKDLVGAEGHIKEVEIPSVKSIVEIKESINLAQEKSPVPNAVVREVSEDYLTEKPKELTNYILWQLNQAKSKGHRYLLLRVPDEKFSELEQTLNIMHLEFDVYNERVYTLYDDISMGISVIIRVSNWKI